MQHPTVTTAKFRSDVFRLAEFELWQTCCKIGVPYEWPTSTESNNERKLRRRKLRRRIQRYYRTLQQQQQYQHQYQYYYQQQYQQQQQRQHIVANTPVVTTPESKLRLSITNDANSKEISTSLQEMKMTPSSTTTSFLPSSPPSAKRNHPENSELPHYSQTGNLKSTVYPSFSDQNPGVMDAAFRVLDYLYLHRSHAPSVVGPGLVLAAESCYGNPAKINLHRPHYLRQSFSKTAEGSSERSIDNTRKCFVYGAGHGAKTFGTIDE